MRMAQQRAGEILEHRQPRGGRRPPRGDEYAAGVLIRLEGECIKALTSIKRGIDMLDERHRVPRRRRRTAPAQLERGAGGDRSRAPGRDRPQRGGPAPGAARSGSRGRACATATSPWAPTSSWPGRSTASSGFQRTNRGILVRGESTPRCAAPASAAWTRSSSRSSICISRGVPAERRSRRPARPRPDAGRRRGAARSTRTTRSTWRPSCTMSCR